MNEIIKLKKTILEDNDADAFLLRHELEEQGTFYINIMSSPGSGKTSVLLKTIPLLKDYKVAVMEADLDGSCDTELLHQNHIKAIQLHTGGMCHLDADMSRQGLKAFDETYDIVFLENVGNLVCPAEFDTGAHLNVVILSIPEGDDKPLKYPLVFTQSDIVLVNKIDALPVFDFDMDKMKKEILKKNPHAKIFPVSAKTGKGIKEWVDGLMRIIEERNHENI